MIPKTVPLDKTHATEDSPRPLDETPVSPTDRTLTPDAVPATSRALAGLTGPQKIGRYVFLEHLGEGGMGVVLAAYDPALDRRVAIKLIHALRSDDNERRLRTEREAQAMAKLSHPNVVTVYEVGEYEGQLFLAMEFVKGQDLRKWLAQRKEGEHWRAVLGMFIQAGEGLAAAHRAGLVHRDFKPDNVFVGEDGRARVGDFGLARQGAETDAETVAMRARAQVATDSTALMYSLTATGAAMGTPAYMAPEQFNGKPTDARTDQFSFCVALWEALYGQRPFAGGTLAQLIANVTGGKREPPPAARARSVPGWLRRVIERGLSPEPGDRYPTTEAMLAALRADPTRRRLIGLVAAGVAVMAGGTAIVGTLARPAPVVAESPCAATDDALGGIWDGPRRSQVAGAFTAIDRPFATAAFTETGRAIDSWVVAYQGQRQDACQAHLVKHEQSGERFDRRMTCLGRLRGQLDALVIVLAAADAQVAANASTAVAGLRAPETCADPGDALAPPPAAQAARVDEIRTRLDQVHALVDTGKPRDALPLAEQAEKDAVATGYGPLVAEARLRLGHGRRAASVYREARPTVREALVGALAAGDDALAAEAATLLVLVDVNLGLVPSARDDLAIATAVVTRAGQSPTRDSKLYEARGELALISGTDEEAEEAFLAAIAAETIASGKDGVPALELRLRYLYSGGGRDRDLTPTRVAIEEVMHALETRLGKDHPAVATALWEIANILEIEHKLDQSKPMFERGLAMADAALGGEAELTLKYKQWLIYYLPEPDHLAKFQELYDVAVRALGERHHQTLGIYSSIVAGTFFTKGPKAALPMNEKLLADREAVGGPDNVMLGEPLINLSQMYGELGRFQESADAGLRAARIWESAFGPDDRRIGIGLSNAGLSYLGMKQYDVALPLLRRALAIKEKIYDADSDQLWDPLVGIGAVLLAQKNGAESVLHYERALALAAGKAGPANERKDAKVNLVKARALARRR